MQIAVLSRGPSLYSTQSLLIAGQRRGHRMFLIDYMDCSLSLSPGRPSVYYKEERLPRIDAIIPRIGSSGTTHGAAIIRQFEQMGVYTTLTADALLSARDKLTCYQILANSGLQFPLTTYGSIQEAADYLLDSVGGVPVILKLLRSTHGLGVMLLEDRRTAESVIETFQRLKETFIVQEFIREAKGEDVRALMVDGELVAAMKRKAMPGEFRSNLHRGGSAIQLELTKEELNVARVAVQRLGLGVAGVDILQSKRGPLILEVNPSPGLEGIETTTQIDVAGAIIELIERQLIGRKKIVS